MAIDKETLDLLEGLNQRITRLEKRHIELREMIGLFREEDQERMRKVETVLKVKRPDHDPGLTGEAASGPPKSVKD
jgi:hypothetical protein